MENMTENQKEKTAEFIGQVAYLIGKRGKKGAIDYLSKKYCSFCQVCKIYRQLCV